MKYFDREDTRIADVTIGKYKYRFYSTHWKYLNMSGIRLDISAGENVTIDSGHTGWMEYGPGENDRGDQLYFMTVIKLAYHELNSVLARGDNLFIINSSVDDVRRKRIYDRITNKLVDRHSVNMMTFVVKTYNGTEQVRYLYNDK